MKKNTLIIHSQHMEAIKSMTIEDRGVLLTAMLEYQFEDVEPQNLPPSVATPWLFIKPFIIRMNEQYDAICERNRANGQKGGRPKKD